jgi:hypothetical protein
MQKTINVCDYKSRSKNQLMAIICHLEIIGIDTKDLDVNDWEILTVRLSLEYDISDSSKPIMVRAWVGAIYKEEKTYETLNLEYSCLENCETFERFISITKLIKNSN